MESPLFKRSWQDFYKHCIRCKNCKAVASFCYRKKSAHEYEILRTYYLCHSYFCERCSAKKRNKLQKRLKNLRYNKSLRFLTLTLSTEMYSQEESVDKISQQFNLLVKFLRYRGYKFQYFKVIELTKKGQAHIHAFVTQYIDINHIRECWKFITGSYIVDIKNVKDDEFAKSYLLKYFTKSSNQKYGYLFYLLRKRRFSYSQSMFLPGYEEPPFLKSNITFDNDNDLFHYVNVFFDKRFFNSAFLRFILLN